MPTALIEPEVETPVEEEPSQADEPKLVGWKQRVRDLLAAIFEGHQEFLGWTPD